MKLLVTSARLYPLDRGDRLTVFHLLKHCSKRDDISLGCFLESDQDPAWVEKFAPFASASRSCRSRNRAPISIAPPAF